MTNVLDEPVTVARTLFADPSRRITGIVARLAWPVVAERLTLTLLAAVDALLVGRYVGADGVAAVGVGGLMLWVPLSATIGAEIAAAALVARAVGSGSAEAMQRATRAAVLCALVCGVLLAVVLVASAPLLMRLIGTEPEVGRMGVRFLRPAALGLPFLLVMTAANGALRGTGDTLRPMLVLVAVNAINFLVTFGLISGAIGVELGVAATGIGYATAATAGGALALAMVVRRGSGLGYRLSAAALRPGREAVRRFLNVAAPVTLEEMQFTVAFLAYTWIIAGAGTTALAAHTIALRAQEVAIVPGFAIGAAATTLVGQALGMGRPDLARSASMAALRLALVVMVVLGGALAIFAPWVARLFVSDPEVVETAALLFRVFALAYPMLAVLGTLSGALRGAGDVRYVLAAGTLTTWCIRIPVAWLLAVGFGLGAPGAWVGAVADNTTRGGLVWARFRSGRWTRIGV